MQVTITIPQNIINTCLECGWEEAEIQILFQKYLTEVVADPYELLEQDFQIWLEDQDEEQLQSQLN